MNTLNYKINNNIYSTHYYIKKTGVGLGVQANMKLGADTFRANVELEADAFRSNMGYGFH